MDLKAQAIKDCLFVDIIFAGVAKTGNSVLLRQCPENALAGGENVGAHGIDRVSERGFGVDDCPTFIPKHLNDVFQE